MKKNNKNIEVKVKPERLTRAERRHAKNMQTASEQLENYHQAAKFHIAYLEIEHEIEEAKYEEIKARLDALNAAAEVAQTVVTEEVQGKEVIEF